MVEPRSAEAMAPRTDSRRSSGWAADSNRVILPQRSPSGGDLDADDDESRERPGSGERAGLGAAPAQLQRPDDVRPARRPAAVEAELGDQLPEGRHVPDARADDVVLRGPDAGCHRSSRMDVPRAARVLWAGVAAEGPGVPGPELATARHHRERALYADGAGALLVVRLAADLGHGESALPAARTAVVRALRDAAAYSAAR